MYCVFISDNGAHMRFVAFTDELDRWIAEPYVDGLRFYCGFPKYDDAKRMTDLINSATF